MSVSRRRLRHHAAVLLASTSIVVTTAAPAVAGPAGQLSQTRAQLSATKQGLAAAQGAQATAQVQLAQADQSLATAQVQLQLDQGRVAQAKLSQQAAQTELATDQAQIASLTAVIDARARDEYMTGAPSTLSVLMESRSAPSLLNRVATLNMIAQSSNSDLTAIQRVTAAARVASAQVVAATAQASAAAAAMQAQVVGLRAIEQQRAEALAAAQAQVTAASRAETGLAYQSVMLEGDVAAAEQAAHVRMQRAAASTFQRSAETNSPPQQYAAPSAPQGSLCSLAGTSWGERWIIQHESGDNPYAQNPTSSAFGIGQLELPARLTYLGANADTTNCALQMQAFRSYIAARYGSASQAVAFWKAHGWY